MDECKKRLIHIHHCRGIGWKMIYRILKEDSTLQSIYNMSISKICSTFGIKLQQAQIFHFDLHENSPESILKNLIDHNIYPVTIFEDEYPQTLKMIYDPPWVLYCKGNSSFLNHPTMLSIVGSRTSSPYSIHCLEKIIPPLIKKDFTIVSGMAIGVDTIAHKLTIREKGHTIAVLGSGFFHIYPYNNKTLAETMGRQQLLITEYPPHFRPQKWYFPERNRIISGLTRGVLVVEAKDRSGSLITADQALDVGRDVFAIPGSILSENSDGTHRLIQSGAKLVMCAEDIFDEWNL